MPFTTVQLRPGVNVEATQLQNQAGISSSQLGRFKGGLFQKLGGWQKYITGTITGVPRALLAWQDLNKVGRLATGATSSLSVVAAGTLTDISPQVLTTNPAVSFTTTIGSANVTITDAGINTVTTFDSITLNTPVAVGGLILFGLYPIASVSSSTSYVIVAASNATANATNAGAVPSFTTTNSSSLVTVTLTAHGLVAGQTIVFPVSTTVGGVTISGSYPVSSVTSANAFVIIVNGVATSATSGGMNAGNAQIVYSITLGPPATGTAYGFSTYGSGTYGGIGASSTVQTGAALAASTWTLDNWGQILVGCPLGGALYYWDPSGSLSNATPITQGPLYNSGVFVSTRFQIMVAFGSTPLSKGIGLQQDPLFVRWSDQGNFNQWVATSSTLAGSYRLPSGSRIIAGMAAQTKNYLWTDLALWSMDYIGGGLVFGFNRIADNCGIIGPHAYATLSNTTYWMGPSNFFATSGSGVAPIPCTVWDAVFQDLDLANASKCFTWSNTPFNEVWFFYPSISGGIGECDKYVKYNTAESSWDNGPLQRSAAIDQSVLGNPIAASRSGVVYLHETGQNDDGAAMNPFMETGFFQIGDGEDLVFVDRIIPDMKWSLYGQSATASVKITLKATKYPGDTPTQYGPFTVTQATQFVPVRIRGRQMSMRVESTDLGSFWRIGGIRYRYASDGRQ